MDGRRQGRRRTPSYSDGFVYSAVKARITRGTEEPAEPFPSSVCGRVLPLLCVCGSRPDSGPLRSHPVEGVTRTQAG